MTDPARFPKALKEAPQLAALVKAGKLPAVAERVGQDPLVIKPLHEIGTYGGTWRGGFTGPADFWNGYRCCSVGPRRLGAGADPESPGRPAGGLPADVPLRGARPECRAPHQQPGGGDVRRTDGRAGRDGGDLHDPAAPLHRRAPVGGPRTRSPRAPPSHRAARRGRQPRRSPDRLLLPPAAPTRSTRVAPRPRPGKSSHPATSSAATAPATSTWKASSSRARTVVEARPHAEAACARRLRGRGGRGRAIMASRCRRSSGGHGERAANDSPCPGQTPGGGWGVERAVPGASYGDRRAMLARPRPPRPRSLRAQAASARAVRGE